MSKRKDKGVSRHQKNKGHATSRPKPDVPVPVRLDVNDENPCRVSAEVSIVVLELGENGTRKCTFRSHEDAPPRLATYRAIVDTGSPCSLVTERVVEHEGLISSAMVPVAGLTGSVEHRPAYWVSFAFQSVRQSNKSEWRVLAPCMAPLLRDDLGFDVLLGMDAIRQGDLRLPNRLTKANKPATLTVVGLEVIEVEPKRNGG